MEVPDVGVAKVRILHNKVPSIYYQYLWDNIIAVRRLDGSTVLMSKDEFDKEYQVVL
jgi:hypothetical protein